MSKGATPKQITLLIPDENVYEAPQPSTPLKPGEVQEQGPVGAVWRWIIKDKKVPLAKVKTQMKRVEGEIDGLLASLKASTVSGYQLQEVQVSVGISAGGTLGVVTAGVSATLTLVYSHS